jgi:hypothetical protein
MRRARFRRSHAAYGPPVNLDEVDLDGRRDRPQARLQQIRQFVFESVPVALPSEEREVRLDTDDRAVVADADQQGAASS